MTHTPLKSNLYTYGKFGKALRETLDTDSGTLYDRGKIRSKLKPSDINPDDFCPIHCRDIWYMDGFIRTSNIRHVAYVPAHLNHLFKDDTLYISYERPIKPAKDGAFTTYSGADFHISGNDIVNVVNHAEQHGLPEIQHEIQHVKAEIREKVKWFKEHHPDEYFRVFNTNDDTDVFKHYKQ